MYKPGDIILVRSRHWFGGIILWFMRKTDTDDVNYSHVAVIENENTIMQARLKIERHELNSYLESCKSYKIVRYKKVPDIQRGCVINQIIPLLETPYGVPRLFLFVLDKIFNTHRFTRMSNKFYNRVCSSLIAWAYYRCYSYLTFNNVYWASCDPDDIDDHITNNPDDWEVISIKK